MYTHLCVKMDSALGDQFILYLHYKDLGKKYNENLEKLMEIGDIETFWRTFNNVPKIYEIFSDGRNIKKMKRNNATPCAYSFFRKDVEPCWEDPKNCQGFEFSVKNGNQLQRFQEEWMNCIVELVINKNDVSRRINGIRIVDCTKFDSVLYRMEIWVENEEHRDEIEQLLNSDSWGLKRYKFLYRSHKGMKEAI